MRIEEESEKNGGRERKYRDEDKRKENKRENKIQGKERERKVGRSGVERITSPS
jgi:hypothetical protein